jgi:hypothetical protein
VPGSLDEYSNAKIPMAGRMMGNQLNINIIRIQRRRHTSETPLRATKKGRTMRGVRFPSQRR